MTKAQARGLEKLPEYLLADGRIEEAFGRSAPLLVEVGFGNGDALAEYAAAHPDWNCIGIEVFRPGIGALINRCESQELTNVRIVESEGLTYLEKLETQTVDLIWVLFPDPWPKARHHKRRLITSEFGTTASRCLKKGGTLRIATDWADYAEQIEASLCHIREFDGGMKKDANTLLQTKYGLRGRRLGHEETHFEYEKC